MAASIALVAGILTSAIAVADEPNTPSPVRETWTIVEPVPAPRHHVSAPMAAPVAPEGPAVELFIVVEPATNAAPR